MGVEVLMVIIIIFLLQEQGLIDMLSVYTIETFQYRTLKVPLYLSSA